MMRRDTIALLVLALAFLAPVRAICAGASADSAQGAPAAPGPAREAAPGPTRGAGNAKVSYIAGSSVYLDVGREEGLREGDTLAVVRDGAAFARLRVVFLSSHRASCELVGEAASLHVGDTVSFAPHREASATAGASSTGGASAVDSSTHASSSWIAPADTAATAHRPARRWLRGRIGAQALTVRDATGAGNLSQPGLDLRLDGTGVAGLPIDIATDVRAHRTSRSPAIGTPTGDESRVYRLSFAWRDQLSRQRLILGRQFSPTIATVSIFDGVLAELNREHWSVGAFSGTQPSPLDMGFSADILEHGAYFDLHSRQGVERRWSLTTGAIASYDHGQLNRDFLYIQGQYLDPKFSASMAQEVDYNSGWKIGAGEQRVSPTSTFATLRWQASHAVSFYSGYDNRRNVRLYRDRETPETQFDDSHRQGAWLGTSADLSDHFRVGGDARSSFGGAAGNADNWSLNAEAFRLTGANLRLRARSTRYTTPENDGWLHSLSLGANLGAAGLELSGGLRSTTDTAAQTNSRVGWQGVDLDLALARQWYLLVTGERDRGGGEHVDQLYSSLSWRF